MTTLLRTAAAAIAAVALGAGAAQAAGTTAGTDVTNTFTLDYSVGGVDQPQITNDADGERTIFRVDRKVDLTLTSEGNTTVAPGETDAELLYKLTNLGNDVFAYALTVDAGVTETPGTGETAADYFNATGASMTYYIDDGDGVFEPGTGAGEDGAGTTYTPGVTTSTVDVPADAVVWVVVDADIPTAGGNLSDGDEADVILTADTLEPSTAGAGTAGNAVTGTATNTLLGEETVLADGAGSTDSASQGDFSATGTYILSSADLVAGKAVGVFAQTGGCGTLPATMPTSATPTNAGFAIPGACVEYRIQIQNTGANTANELAIVDTLPGELQFVDAQRYNFTGGAWTEPATNANCSTATCTVSLTSPTGNLASLAGNTTGMIVIRALVR